MTPEEHRLRHVELHRALDELLAEFMISQDQFPILNRPILELKRWAYQQTIAPDHPPKRTL